jgi:hypothetical protein
MLDAPIAAFDPRIMTGMHLAALAKWWLFVALMALVGLAFYARPGWVRALSLFYLVVATVGVVGLTLELPMVELFFALIAVALIPSGEAVWRIRRATPAPPTT